MIHAQPEEFRMTKAKTVGQRKRGRPRKEGARDQKTGRLARGSAERREEAQRAVAIVRCKAMGWDITIDNMRRALADHLGCNAGRAIDAHGQRPELWAAIKAIRAVYARYWQAIGAPPPYAKVALLTYLPEPFGSDDVDVSTWDDRTEVERVKAATAAMMRMEQALGMAGEGVRAEIKGVVLMDEPVRSVARLLAGLKAVGQ
jgi:hypothetical protein